MEATLKLSATVFHAWSHSHVPSFVVAIIRVCSQSHLPHPPSVAPSVTGTFPPSQPPSFAPALTRTFPQSRLPSLALVLSRSCPRSHLPSSALMLSRTCPHSQLPSLNPTQTTKSQAIKRPLGAVPSSFALKRGILWVSPLPRAAKRSLSVRLSEWREEERSMISVRPSALDPILPGALPPNI